MQKQDMAIQRRLSSREERERKHNLFYIEMADGE
jgi:hypothetical protein